MAVLVIVLLALVAALAAALYVAVRRLVDARRPDTWLDGVTSERILVHTVESQTIDGTLLSAGADGLVLVAARFAHTDQPVTFAGDLWVPRDKIRVVQRPGVAG